MQAQSSSELLLSRKRKRDGSNGEMEEGERSGKIPRCTVVSQLSRSGRFFRVYMCPSHSGYEYTHMCMWKCDGPTRRSETNVTCFTTAVELEDIERRCCLMRFNFVFSSFLVSVNRKQLLRKIL